VTAVVNGAEVARGNLTPTGYCDGEDVGDGDARNAPDATTESICVDLTRSVG
jgi:hypothetical protein